MGKDIDAMNDRELLVELADRVTDWFDKLVAADAFHLAEKEGMTDDERNAVMDEDEAWCLVREIVRKVKNDKYLWQC